MDDVARRLIASLHQTSFRCVLAMTGGGAGAAAMLLNVPGASRTILEVIVPYDERSLIEFLGRRPEQFCSAATAAAMASRAQERARWLSPGENVGGVGCTASLATDRPKRGDHRFHVAIRTAGRTTTHSLTLTKDARDRESEAAILDAVLLNTVAEAVGVSERLVVALLPGEVVDVETTADVDRLSALFRAEIPTLCLDTDGRHHVPATRPAALLPGSFNPIHAGHLGLAVAAESIVGGPAALELSVVNVDKPPLTAEEVRRRAAVLAWRRPLWLTRAPTFAEKAELFPGVVFVVGADTAERVVRNHYYGGDDQRMRHALDSIRERGCRFLVAGRRCADGRFLTLDELTVPPLHRDLFEAIPEPLFHADVSSTGLRGA